MGSGLNPAHGSNGNACRGAIPADKGGSQDTRARRTEAEVVAVEKVVVAAR